MRSPREWGVPWAAPRAEFAANLPRQPGMTQRYCEVIINFHGLIGEGRWEVGAVELRLRAGSRRSDFVNARLHRAERSRER